LNLAAAQEELRRERRVALVFRGRAFYDARRWGVIFDITKGGGRKGAVALSSTGVLSSNATINYDFLDTGTYRLMSLSSTRRQQEAHLL